MKNFAYVYMLYMYVHEEHSTTALAFILIHGVVCWHMASNVEWVGINKHELERKGGVVGAVQHGVRNEETSKAITNTEVHHEDSAQHLAEYNIPEDR